MPPKEKKNSKENVEKAVKALKESATVPKKQAKPAEKNTKDNTDSKSKKTTKKQTNPIDSNEPQTEKKREPSGFMKPIQVSSELNNFFSNDKGTLMSRTEVTRKFTTYIKDNKLQDPDNGRKINPDAKLKTLLRIQDGEELTFFNLQRYMSPHFSKAGNPPIIP
tara:strand:+ start:413 stop:904 length:492 start_codon:yes stop_codon:yes gene_type:complete